MIRLACELTYSSNSRRSFSCSFLNDLDRIASRDYVVTDDDVVRARLRTVGIQEHTLFFGSSPWDVGRCMSIVSYIFFC